MKILIDIDGIVIEPIQNILNSGSDIPLGINAHMIKAIANGTPISDNATNGDVILELLKGKEDCIYPVDTDKMGITVGVDWWNAPYQKRRANDKT